MYHVFPCWQKKREKITTKKARHRTDFEADQRPETSDFFGLVLIYANLCSIGDNYVAFISMMTSLFGFSSFINKHISYWTVLYFAQVTLPWDTLTKWGEEIMLIYSAQRHKVAVRIPSHILTTQPSEHKSTH